MRKQVKKWEDLMGKTIEKVDEIASGMAFTFDDGTYAFIESGRSWDGDRADPELAELSGPQVGSIDETTASTLAQLGIWDTDEYDCWKIVRDEWKGRFKADREQKERETLAQLKAKYEPK